MFQYSRSRPPTHRPRVPKSQNPNVAIGDPKLLHDITVDVIMKQLWAAYDVAEKISLQIMACARLVAKQKKLGILILKAWFPYGRKHVVTVS